MFPKINRIPAEDLPKMELLVKQYYDLTRAAERCNRDHRGKPTAQEMAYYSQAAKACEQILNLVLPEEAIRLKWQHRHKSCLRMVDEIHNALLSPHAPAPPPSEGPDTPGAETKTASGFVTKNACREVPAEEIEKWYQKKSSVTLDALTGMEILKDHVKNLKLWWEWPAIHESFPHPAADSWFFYGLPGTGKTQYIRAIAAELMDAGYCHIALRGSDIWSCFVGEAEKMVQIVFQEAMDHAPCVLSFDDLENVCVNRGNPNIAAHQHRLTVVFLQALSRLRDSGKPVLLLTSSNHPDLVDDAFIDHSRRFRFSLPSAADRADFFARNLEHLPVAQSFSIADMAAATEHYSFPELWRMIYDISIQVRRLAIDQYAVYDGNGDMDISASDRAAADAIAGGRIPVTRVMFEDVLARYPISDRTPMLERLRTFEERLYL